MTDLRASYRLQLRDGMTFATARALVPYWKRLGVSHVYLSPVMAARAGSPHGYDVTDPARVEPSLGGERGLRALGNAARRAGLGLLLDIVPNHAAAHADNPYFDDVLRRGRASPYAAWFDIDWSAGPVVLPRLGEPLPRAIASGAIRLAVEHGEVRVRYAEQSFPLDPATLPPAWRAAPPAPGALARFSRERAGHGRLARLLARQPYRLRDWRHGRHAISYRRFFDIDDLIALRAEIPEVFDALHAKTLELLVDGVVDGLRVDHVDGLWNPGAYLERLRRAAREGGRGQAPILVEKILAPDEHLRDDWPVDGTTGYEALNQLEAVFLDPAGAAAIEAEWRRITGRRASFGQTARAGKRLVLREGLSPDLERLGRALRADGAAPPPPAPAIRRALVETIAALPVYRTYADERGRLPAAERRRLEHALAEARRHGADARAVRYLDAALLGPPDGRGRRDRQERERRAGRLGRQEREQRATRLGRLQQLTGPAAARGVEDTALYIHVPLLSRNEVGSEPDAALERAAATLHREASRRQRRWPRTLLAATTHDTKRSADARSRLDVLTELPAAWTDAVRTWRHRNDRHRQRAGRRRFPDANTELLLYQTLVGLWPLPGAAPPARRALAALEARVQRIMHKAVREAKVHTSWRRPNAAFEAALAHFTRALLRPSGPEPGFVDDLHRFVRRIARPGLWNGLARLLVQLTAPGVPDLYQGDDLWSFSGVDPDNRRPVDFALRRRLLLDVERRFATTADGRQRLLDELIGAPEDGRIKLHVIQRTLHTRRRHPALFTASAYTPLRARGPHARHVVAFARQHRDAFALVAVPRLPRTLVGNDIDAPCGEDVWGPTALALPGREQTGLLASPLTGERLRLDPGARAVPLARLLGRLPVGLWLWQPR